MHNSRKTNYFAKVEREGGNNNSNNMTFVPTCTVIVQTSAGNLHFDLAGVQFPFLTAQFVNFARCKYWNGAVIREVIPDIAAFFALDSESHITHMFTRNHKKELEIKKEIVKSETTERSCNKDNNYNNIIARSDEINKEVFMPISLDFWALFHSAIKSRNEYADADISINTENVLSKIKQRELIHDEVHKSKRNYVASLQVYLSRSVQPSSVNVYNHSYLDNKHNKHNNNNTNKHLLESDIEVCKDERPVIRDRVSNKLLSPFHIDRAGLLLVEVNTLMPTLLPNQNNNNNNDTIDLLQMEAQWHYNCKFAVTLSNNRNMDFLINKNYIVIGSLSIDHYEESWETLKKIRACPLTPCLTENTSSTVLLSSANSTTLIDNSKSQFSVGSSIVYSDTFMYPTEQQCLNTKHGAIANEHFPRPIRAIRLKHVYVLPTLGTESYLLSSSTSSTATATAEAEKMSSVNLSYLSSFSSSPSSSPYSSGSKSKEEMLATTAKLVRAKALHQVGCFRYWASNEAVRIVNNYLAHLLEIHTCHVENDIANNSDVGSSNKNNNNVVNNVNKYCEESLSITAIHAKHYAMSNMTSNNKSNYNIRLPERYWQVNKSCIDNFNNSCNADNNNDDNDNDDNSNIISFEVDDENSRVAAKTTLTDDSVRSYNNAATNTFANDMTQEREERVDESLSLMLSLLEGITDTSIRPAPNVLFVCKLNPVTDEAGLQMCFSQFGGIKEVNVIRDKHTQRSLCYAFIEFNTVDSCATAFQKMNNVLIDDFRVKVDFSQSVSKVWRDRQRQTRKRSRV